MRKQLAPLTNLSRSAEGSVGAKVVAPSAPKATAKLGKAFAPISAYTPTAVLQWIKAFWHYRVGPRHHFQTYKSSNGIFPMLGDSNGDTRVCIAGDWGSGTQEAYEVGQQIKVSDPHYTVHLGDVYYIGTSQETEENYLGNSTSGYEPCTWPSGANGTFSLCGNHEMYSRGFSFYDLVLPAMTKQEAGYFCLENQYWRVIGLDTGYNSVGIPVLDFVAKPSCDLRQEELDWLENIIKPEQDSRGLVILSHHQYYSAFEQQYVKIAQQLATVINRPVLWIWGHEHRMAVYEKYSSSSKLEAYGRCIGHGGMPVETAPVKHTEVPLVFTDSRLYPNNENLKIGYNGFAALTFNKNTLKINYKDLNGIVVYDEQLTVNNGIIQKI